MDKQDKSIVTRKDYSHILLWLIVFIGVGIRAYNLGSHNLWYDEFISFLDLKYARPEAYVYSQFQAYTFLMRFWAACFGTSELALRFPSMIFGALAIPLIYKLGKLLFDKRVGLASAFIISISPIHIWYSQEARAYSLSVFLTMLTVYFLFLSVKMKKLRLWIGFTFCTILSIYTNYYCFYLLITSGALIIFINRHLLKQWILIACFVSAACSFLLPPVIKHLSSLIKINWVPKPHLNAIAITFDNFNVGFNATANINLFAFMIFLILFILGVWNWWKEKRKEIIALILLLSIPIVITFLISQVLSIYLYRRLILFSPFYYLIIAAGLVKIKANIIRRAAYCCISLIMVICLYNYFSYHMPLPLRHHEGVHPKKPVKPAADYISKKFLDGDIIGYSGPTGACLFYYMWDKIIKEKISVFSFVIKSRLELYWRKRDGIYFAGNLITKRLIRLEEEESCKDFEGHSFKRLWLISSSWARDGILGYHTLGVREWMQKHYSVLDSKEFDGISIDLYGRKTD